MEYSECIKKYPIGTKVNYYTTYQKETRYYMSDADLEYWKQRASRYNNFTIEGNGICSYIKKVEHYNVVQGYIINSNLEGFPAELSSDGWREINIQEDKPIIYESK